MLALSKNKVKILRKSCRNRVEPPFLDFWKLFAKKI